MKKKFNPNTDNICGRPFRHLICFLFILIISSCNGQSKNDTNMKDQQIPVNPLLCDPAEGICVIPDSTASETLNHDQSGKKIKVIYFTDPICSSCWGIEPQLRKLKLEYGNGIEIEYHMGGLLPDWTYNSGGISKPSDVAHHWDEVSIYYDMPIDGDIWLEDPLDSSYPPSIAFKAAELQSKEKALIFLREMREMVFLKKKNIAKWEHIAEAAKKAGLNTEQLKTDFEGKAKQLFEEDLKLARTSGVRGFPTLFFVSNTGSSEIVYGSKPYETYVAALKKVAPEIKKTDYKKTTAEIFSVYPSLTANEYSFLSEKSRIESESILNRLTEEGKLLKLTIKNGSLWMLTK